MTVEHEKLTVILPVANQQKDVARRLESLLDELTELCQQVQIVVVDDGTTDATSEILDELRRSFPQITGHRLAKRIGASKAVELGLKKATGDFIFLHESYEPVDIDALIQLWSLRHDRELVIARASTRHRRIDSPLLEKLSSWGKSLQDHWKQETKSLEEKPLQRKLQMMRREAVERMARVDSQQNHLEVSHLSQRRIVRPNCATKGS